jgi:hypothetical protein
MTDPFAPVVSGARVAHAFWVVRPGAGEIRSEQLPPTAPAQVCVRTLYSGVSRGTESLVFHGRVPESEHERMRCPHQAGAFPAPVKYGYANVGMVVEGPSSLRGCTVFSLYPHQTAYVVDESSVVALPPGLDPARAVLAANMETALNALWDAGPLLGDRLSVVGAGVVGCLSAYLAARIAGADVELVDIRADRARVAEALGVGFATSERAQRDRDLVLHASGTAAGLRTALDLAAAESTIVELSWFGDTEVALPLGRDFHARRLTLRSSQVGTLSPRARRRHTRRSRLEAALALCVDPALDVLIDGESDFFTLAEIMPRLASPASAALCHRLRYPQRTASS